MLVTRSRASSDAWQSPWEVVHCPPMGTSSSKRARERERNILWCIFRCCCCWVGDRNCKKGAVQCFCLGHDVVVYRCNRHSTCSVGDPNRAYFLFGYIFPLGFPLSANRFASSWVKNWIDDTDRTKYNATAHDSHYAITSYSHSVSRPSEKWWRRRRSRWCLGFSLSLFLIIWNCKSSCHCSSFYRFKCRTIAISRRADTRTLNTFVHKRRVQCSVVVSWYHN